MQVAALQSMEDEPVIMEEMKRNRIEGRAIPLRGDDIDTDRIIPARYLKCVTFDELGAYAFYDERFDPDGNERPHPFNDPKFRGAEVLVVNKNFGCGSSREHAPQSLMRMGIRAIVGESFAEIFAGNCTALGIPAATSDSDGIERLMNAVEADPAASVCVDLESRTVSIRDDDLCIDITMPESYRTSLLQGAWDTTAALLANLDAVRAVRQRLPYTRGY